MLLFCYLSSNSGKPIYLLEDCKSNRSLFLRDPNIRDNGVIYIESCVAIQNPRRTTKYIEDDIPLVSTQNLLICLKVSDKPTVDLHTAIPNNRTASSCIEGMKIEVLSMTPAETNCSGLLCDRQRTVNTTAYRKGRGCYLLNNRRACVVMVYTNKFSNIDSTHDSTKTDFNSLRFSSLF